MSSRHSANWVQFSLEKKYLHYLSLCKEVKLFFCQMTKRLFILLNIYTIKRVETSVCDNFFPIIFTLILIGSTL